MKRNRTQITGREKSDEQDRKFKRRAANRILRIHREERVKEKLADISDKYRRNSLCDKFGRCKIQGGSLMRGGSPIQQTFGETDSAMGALNSANNNQIEAGEQAIKIKNETNRKQIGGYATDFMPHPSMSNEQAGVQQGLADTYQQGSANAEHDSKVPTPNKCLREQAGAGRVSIFRKTKKKRKRGRKKKTKKRKTRKTKKRRRSRKKTGGRRRKKYRKINRFSKHAPMRA
tara:strand:- start:151 stop:843 length:693 start_codon:yes stop_codon:yes gene_type:complete